MKMLIFTAVMLFFGIVHVMACEPAAVCKETDDTIVVTMRGKHVLTYHKKEHVPEGISAGYARSGFLHPVTTPAGRAVTDGFPRPHHAHQHGVFMAWTKCRFDGRKINFWEHHRGGGRVRHDKVLHIKNEADFAEFRVRLIHSDRTAPGGETAVLHDVWTVRVPVVKPGDPHVIDIRSEQQCASGRPLTQEKYHYGGMAIRGSAQWINLEYEKAKNKKGLKPGCTMLTSEGKDQHNGNHSRPNWVAIFGPVDGQTAGAALLTHPDNFRHPQAVRLHPNMPYFCYAPMVDGAFAIKPGETYTSRYRVVAFDGQSDSKRLNELRDAFQAAASQRE